MSACRIARVAPFSIPGGAVADHPVELRPQLRDDLCDPVLSQAILVLALRGRQQSERVQALVSNEGLRELGLAFDDVDEIKDHASLGTHHEVEIAQADIEVDDHHLLSSLCKRRPQRCCRGRLADSALPEVTTSTLPCRTFVFALVAFGLGFFIAGISPERP